MKGLEVERIARHSERGSSQERRKRLGRRILSQGGFRAQLSLERRRSERSGRAFALLLMDCRRSFSETLWPQARTRLLSAFHRSTRDTDLVGWHEQDLVLGVILAECGESGIIPAVEQVRERISKNLGNSLGTPLERPIRITVQYFPEGRAPGGGDGGIDLTFYPELIARRPLKRLIDIVGSILGLVLLWPLFAVIALAVRLGSKGPALYPQERIGQFGIPFTMYKFRSMHANVDQDIHKECAKQFIAATLSAEANGGIYKLTRDPRITKIGKLLRKTSLDELPQLFNVLKGDMSLVGPRPPLQYEIEEYEAWHRRRVLEAKPGLTGLWQVMGRSRTQFNDMVRLDLHYAKKQSVILDLLLILKTMGVLISDKGAC